ncbi:hypothetical protein I7V28_19150 [Lelliottia amnigena]|uniref:hypothetical protein n=1 Tax=Lelliottia TaxID=1330545 RepID=UPI00192C5808|nr:MULTISPECIES: hypothetical protein [Lelliottia]MBL5885622.1 hypothetical protein [Lelliottia aquatilis]MBL5923200.1 hypothetical protein [Lelliottia amnigena]MBL5932110.1 hypothetical protein [Lelliottia amnigena]
MITHSRFTIADSSSLLGYLRVPGVQGSFEIRSFMDRVKRPRFIVVHENWHDAGRRERIAPVVIMQFEADGHKECIDQQAETSFKGQDLAGLSRRAMEFLKNFEHGSLACHH